MSMLEEGSLIISGGSLPDRKNYLISLINSPHILPVVKEQINSARQNRLTGALPKTAETEIPINDPDIISLVPDGQKLGINQIRDFLSQIRIKPINRSEKIGIILEAEKLTPEAQNALLKTLEEPPSHCVILLSVPNKKDLLPTIISRCLILDLGNPTLEMEEGTLVKITTLSVGEKFALAQKISATRAQALEWLDQLLIDLHSRLLSGEKVGENQFKKAILAKKIIQANGNIRLTLENLFLDW